MRLFPAVALSALTIAALAACSREKDGPAPPAPQPEPAPVLGGVDLTRPVRALGTEPFWGVELTGTEMVLSGPDRTELRAPQSKPEVRGTTASFSGATSGGDTMEVTLIATECSDGMSDRTYPLVAQVKVGDEKLSGCAASVEALATAGEQGPVQPPAQPAG